jgi:hypothetical protein
MGNRNAKLKEKFQKYFVKCERTDVMTNAAARNTTVYMGGKWPPNPRKVLYT